MHLSYRAKIQPQLGLLTSLKSSAACSNNPIIPPSENNRLVHIPSSSYIYMVTTTKLLYQKITQQNTLTGDKSSSDIALSSRTLGDILCKILGQMKMNNGDFPYLKCYTPHREVRLALQQVKIFGYQCCSMYQTHCSLRIVLTL